MPSNISQWLIDRYSAGPSESKVSQVANLQTTIRDVLGDDYDTFLQGSYRNGTAIADINDVDIVARRRMTNAPLSPAQWENLFNTIASKLGSSYRVSGTVSIGDKCVKLNGMALNADIVPAVAIGDFEKTPSRFGRGGRKRTAQTTLARIITMASASTKQLLRRSNRQSACSSAGRGNTPDSTR
jgi:hypothetical protein